MPAIPQTSIGMSSPLPTWRKGSLVIAKEVVVMVVTNEATKEAEEVGKGNLPVGEVNFRAGILTSVKGRTTLYGFIARTSTLPVAALLKIALRNILAVRDSLAE